MERILKVLNSSCYPTPATATTQPCSQVPHLLNPSGAGDHAGLERDKPLDVSPEKVMSNVASPQAAIRGMALLHGWLTREEGFVCCLGIDSCSIMKGLQAKEVQSISLERAYYIYFKQETNVKRGPGRTVAGVD